MDPDQTKRMQEQFSRIGLNTKLKLLWDSWFQSRDDLVLESAGRCQFVDWMVMRIARVSRDDLARWYELRAVHVRGKAQAS